VTLVKRGRIEGRLAETTPIVTSAVDQRPGLTLDPGEGGCYNWWEWFGDWRWSLHVMSLGLMAFREESRQMLMMQTLERVVSFCTLLGLVFMHLSAKV